MTDPQEYAEYGRDMWAMLQLAIHEGDKQFIEFCNKEWAKMNDMLKPSSS